MKENKETNIDNLDGLLDEKAQDYGDPLDYTGALAKIWGAMLGQELSPNQVVAMYVASKSLRGFNNPGHYDSFLDMAGYGSIGCDIVERTKKQ